MKVNFDSKIVKQVVNRIELNEDDLSYKFTSDDEESSLAIDSSSHALNSKPINLGRASPKGLNQSLLNNTERETLYYYNRREQELLYKVIKFMQPAKKNQIWESIFNDGLSGL